MEDLNSIANLVDPEWELIDPTPDVQALFNKFNAEFFAGKLSPVQVRWNSEMFESAGRTTKLGQECVIDLSEPLLKFRTRKNLIETLLHEMIHVWNFAREIYEDNGHHGEQFLAKMNEINELTGTNISVYHSYDVEVDHYMTHWWRCNGVCAFILKRRENCRPGRKDSWWNRHKRDCGGKFFKVKESQKRKLVKVKEKSIEPPTKKFKSDMQDGPSTSISVPVIKPSPPAAAASGGITSRHPRTRQSTLRDFFKPTTKVQPKKRKFKDNSDHVGPSASETVVIDDNCAASTSNGKSYQTNDKTKFDDGNDILIDEEHDDEFSTQIFDKA